MCTDFEDEDRELEELRSYLARAYPPPSRGTPAWTWWWMAILALYVTSVLIWWLLT